MPDLKKLSARGRLRKLADKYTDLNKQVTLLKAMKKKILAEVKPLFLSLGEDKIAFEKIASISKTKGRRQLSEERLLENGVSMKTIEKSYVTGEEGIRITSLKPKDDDDEDE